MRHAGQHLDASSQAQLTNEGLPPSAWAFVRSMMKAVVVHPFPAFFTLGQGQRWPRAPERVLCV